MTDEKAPRRDARAARQVPSPDLPKDCFDVGNGYYDPKDGSIHDYGTKKKVRARTHASSLRWPPATFPVPAPRAPLPRAVVARGSRRLSRPNRGVTTPRCARSLSHGWWWW